MWKTQRGHLWPHQHPGSQNMWPDSNRALLLEISLVDHRDHLSNFPSWDKLTPIVEETKVRLVLSAWTILSDWPKPQNTLQGTNWLPSWRITWPFRSKIPDFSSLKFWLYCLPWVDLGHPGWSCLIDRNLGWLCSTWLILSDQPKITDFDFCCNCNHWWFYTEYFGFHQFLFLNFALE